MSIQNVATSFSDHSAELQSLDRQRQLAMLLQNQALQPSDAGGMVGEVYVPQSPLQGMAKMLQMYAAGKMNDRLDEKQRGLSSQYNQQLAQGLQNYQKTAAGTPAQPGSVVESQQPANVPMQSPTQLPAPNQPAVNFQDPAQLQVNANYRNPDTPAVPGDKNAALAQLISSGHPILQQLGVNQMAAEPELEMKRLALAQALDDKKTTREQQNRQFQLQMADRQQAREEADLRTRQLADQASNDRRFVAGQNNAFQKQLLSQGGKPPPGYRYTPNGDMEAIPGGPADQKQLSALGGKETVSNIVGGLRDSYNQLSSAGGITDPSKGTLSNLAARASSSGLGQFVGGAVGSQNQSVRNSIAMTRPLLLQAIMKATGMSAKQMDSNTELKLYLSTATDPTLDIEANKRALDKIEQLYGGQSPQAQPASTPAPGGWSIKPL